MDVIKKLIKQNFKLYSKILLFIGAMLVFLSSICCKTYAYTEDSNGNLVSENLFQTSDRTISYYGVTASIQEQVLYLNGTSTHGFWGGYQNQPYTTLESGTYTIYFYTDYANPNDVGYGIYYNDNLQFIRSQNGYTTFTLNETTQFRLIIWWRNANQTFNNNYVKTMICSGTYQQGKQWEPYGAVYYSQDNYNSALLNDYGIFRLCSSIQLKLSYLNSSQVDNYEWDSILSLLNDKSYVKCQNGVFSYNNSSLSMDLLGGSSNVTAMWQFNFEGTYPQIKQYPSMIASGYDLRYQIIDTENSLFAYDNITNDRIVDLMEYQYKQIGYFQLYTGAVGIAVNFTSLYFETNYNVAYTRGYEDGKTQGYDEGYEYGEMIGFENGKNNGYDLGYNQGVEDGEASDFATNGFKTLIGSIFNYPINMIRSVFNFEFMGINIAGLITFIISVVIVIFIVHRFKK